MVVYSISGNYFFRPDSSTVYHWFVLSCYKCAGWTVEVCLHTRLNSDIKSVNKILFSMICPAFAERDRKISLEQSQVLQGYRAKSSEESSRWGCVVTDNEMASKASWCASVLMASELRVWEYKTTQHECAYNGQKTSHFLRFVTKHSSDKYLPVIRRARRAVFRRWCPQPQSRVNWQYLFVCVPRCLVVMHFWFVTLDRFHSSLAIKAQRLEGQKL